MQLSELEEEMDQRIQAAEHKTRKDVSLCDQPVQATEPQSTFDGWALGILWVQQVQAPTGTFSKGVFSGGGLGEVERESK